VVCRAEHVSFHHSPTTIDKLETLPSLSPSILDITKLTQKGSTLLECTIGQDPNLYKPLSSMNGIIWSCQICIMLKTRNTTTTRTNIFYKFGPSLHVCFQKREIPIWYIKLPPMCALVINLQIMNSGSRSCHKRTLWSFCWPFFCQLTPKIVFLLIRVSLN
jgi:hypothetical protein